MTSGQKLNSFIRQVKQYLLKMRKKQSKSQLENIVCVRYLRHTAAGVGVAGCVVAEGRQAGQDEVDGADLQSHAAQQHAVVGGQRRAAEQSSQHVEGQRGQDVGRRRLQDVTCRGGGVGRSRGQKESELTRSITVATGRRYSSGKRFLDICHELYCTKKISLQFISVQFINQTLFGLLRCNQNNKLYERQSQETASQRNEMCHL